MKAIVEKVIDTTDSQVDKEFCEILFIITACKTREEIKQTIAHTFEETIINHFEYGFGGSHMWVASKETKERLILVKFEDEI